MRGRQRRRGASCRPRRRRAQCRLIGQGRGPAGRALALAASRRRADAEALEAARGVCTCGLQGRWQRAREVTAAHRSPPPCALRCAQQQQQHGRLVCRRRADREHEAHGGGRGCALVGKGALDQRAGGRHEPPSAEHEGTGRRRPPRKVLRLRLRSRASARHCSGGGGKREWEGAQGGGPASATGRGSLSPAEGPGVEEEFAARTRPSPLGSRAHARGHGPGN